MLSTGIHISASGLAANKLWLQVTASNIANANTTRTDEGGPYRRRTVTFRERLAEAGMPVTRAARGANRDAASFGGVEVISINSDNGPVRLVYEPENPDAGTDGFVAYPNINLANEMVNLITASRAYEANVTVLNTAKSIVLKALEIGRA